MPDPKANGQQSLLLGVLPPDAHAYDVLKNHYTPGWELTGLQRVILGRLIHQLGAQQAMPLRQLLLITGADAREIKEAIRGLVLDFHVRVGASRGDPPGYYLITSREEALATAQPYIAEVRQLMRRVRVLLDPHDLAELEGAACPRGQTEFQRGDVACIVSKGVCVTVTRDKCLYGCDAAGKCRCYERRIGGDYGFEWCGCTFCSDENNWTVPPPPPRKLEFPRTRLRPTATDILQEKCPCGCCHLPDYGACPAFVRSGNGNCVFCDHGEICHTLHEGRRFYNGPLWPGMRETA